MRGYFGIGAEGISKPMNLGNLIRSAHAFGASFVFLIDVHYTARNALSDTSQAERQMPLYRFDAVEELVLPKGCVLIGVELLDAATSLPSFRHPLNAAYVFGPERSALSPAMVARCDHVVRIPTRFCINLAAAGVIVMYDRMLSLGRFAPRPVRAGGPTEPLRPHVYGKPISRRRTGISGCSPCAPPQSAAGDEERRLVVLGRIDRREQQGHHLPDQPAKTRVVDAGDALELAGHRAEEAGAAAEHRGQPHGCAQLGHGHPLRAPADLVGQNGCPIEQQHRPVLRARARPGRRGEVGRLQERRTLVQHGDEARLELRLIDVERVADDDRGEVAPTGAVAVVVRPIAGLIMLL